MPNETPKQVKSAAEKRRERQAAALRDNLRKRKQQARDRRDGDGTERGANDAEGSEPA